MSDGLEVIEEHLVKQYSSNVLYLASQKISKLRGTVLNESVAGEEKFWDQYGDVEMLERTTRFGDSPINITPRESRRLTLSAYETGEPIDSFDKIRMLNDPSNPIVMRHAQAAARQYDRTILNAMVGTNYTGRKAPTAVAWSAQTGQHVAYNSTNFGSGTTGLNTGKLIEAKNIMGEADVDTDNLHIAVTQEQISDMLTATEVRSSDYNSVKALVNGELNSFMGFTFHRVSPSLVPTDASGYRQCMVWSPDAVVLGIGQDVRSYIDQRADKSFNWYVYMEMFLGATRVDEEKLVEIKCQEPSV